MPPPARATAPPRAGRSPIALGRRFYQIGVAVAAEVHEREGTGLRNLEFGVLIHLHDEPGFDQNTLAERMALDRTSISAMVFRLEQQGLIERAVNGSDRRARVLRLSQRASGCTIGCDRRPRRRSSASSRCSPRPNDGRSSRCWSASSTPTVRTRARAPGDDDAAAARPEAACARSDGGSQLRA